MIARLKITLLAIIIATQLIAGVYGIDEIKPAQPLVAKISFDSVLAKAKEHSHELKIANIDTLIARTGIMGARSEYFPKLYFNVGTEYTKNYKDYKQSIVTSVGDAFINPYIRFQSVMGITLQYNVFDFGVRRGRLDLAKEEVNNSELREIKAMQELHLNIVDNYSKILMTKKQLDLYKKINELDKENLALTERLLKAKQISKTDYNDRKVRVGQSQNHINDLLQMLEESLLWLGFYTGEEYDMNNLSVKDFSTPNIDLTSVGDYTKSVTWKYWESEIKKKQLELKITKRTNLPKVQAYGRYYMYGSDYSSYPDAIKDFGPSNLSVGASATMPIFDGLQNYSDIKKVTLELEQTVVRRDKDMAEWMTRLSTLKSNYFWLNNQIAQNEEITKELKDKNSSKTRLLDKKLISKIEANDAKIELIESDIEKIKNTTTAVGILNGIQALIEY